MEIRFKLDLNDEENQAMESLMRESNRTRNNLCETMFIMALNIKKSGHDIMRISALTEIDRDGQSNESV